MTLRPLLSAALLALGLSVPMAASAQTQPLPFLTRAEVEAHMREAVFCYYPSERFSCAWAELYTALNTDHAILHSANAVWPEPMSVLEFRIEWDGDALCIDDDTQGLLAAREAEGYRFPFDLEGLTLLPEDGIPEMIREFRENSSPNACFRYTNDPDIPGQLLQHIFYGGIEQDGVDPVALIPLFAGGVAINPGG